MMLFLRIFTHPKDVPIDLGTEMREKERGSSKARLYSRGVYPVLDYEQRDLLGVIVRSVKAEEQQASARRCTCTLGRNLLRHQFSTFLTGVCSSAVCTTDTVVCATTAPSPSS